MGLFSKRKASNDNQKRIYSLHGLIIKYVTERVDNEEIVLGKSGNVSIKDTEILVLSSKEIIYRSNIDSTNVSFLMSGDGAILTGFNKVENRNQAITIHFVDYIK